MTPRRQQTLAHSVWTDGIGFITGADVRVYFHAAAPDHGIRFLRTDVPGSKAIPARIEYAIPRERRTAISMDGVTVELTEHVMAALAGLEIDNCLVELNAAEPPGCDGSSQAFVEALLKGGVVEQDAYCSQIAVGRSLVVSGKDSRVEAEPTQGGKLVIGYSLDYGPDSPIPAQSRTFEITRETFINEIAFARTFILEEEIEALRALGYGKRTKASDLLIFGRNGVVGNEIRAADECARHKILDCLGDFALSGTTLSGRFQAVRSGHQMNREMVRTLLSQQNAVAIENRAA
ncbi:UDP-3-O-acyl-N-acetylglucosamine deacetylase [Thalassoroseus pseudoceratinae]|uniref:UDP-3-O-acyl-N-acetylglucosamine deacetylase n=1 Tax=Thalassoroseus pseudoceratinae TaxID=2713176 RepID=UPI001420FE07|nr:UDP-3-O-acyl-N-acetylglucosamine deacetylase [Thalassoroseus pseudoceratinae]